MNGSHEKVAVVYTRGTTLLLRIRYTFANTFEPFSLLQTFYSFLLFDMPPDCLHCRHSITDGRRQEGVPIVMGSPFYRGGHHLGVGVRVDWRGSGEPIRCIIIADKTNFCQSQIDVKKVILFLLPVRKYFLAARTVYRVYRKVTNLL